MLLSILIHQPRQLSSIFSHTPFWVWGLLAALLALGVVQMFKRRVSGRRIALMPAAMTLFSLLGLVSSFGASGHLASAVGLWTFTLCASALVVLGIHKPSRAVAILDDGKLNFDLPGSAVPLALILAIFITKYAVGIELALAPELAVDIAYVHSIAALNGAISGAFVGRALRLRRLASQFIHRLEPIPSSNT